MTTLYSDAEQAFIDASVPVHQAADDVRLAIEKHSELTNTAFSIGLEQLGQEKMQDAEYVHDLLVAAAFKAGFDEKSFVVQGLHNTLQEYRGFVAAQEALPQPQIELPPGVEVGADDGLVM